MTMTDVRLATPADLPAILAISNWAALNTAANFAIEPETADVWRADYDETHEMFPWLVAADDVGSIVGFAKAAPWKGRGRRRRPGKDDRNWNSASGGHEAI